MRQLIRFAAITLTLLCAVGATGHGDDPWVVPEEERARANPYPATPEALEGARTVFQQQCSMCHGAKGDGTGQVAKMMGIHPADLTDAEMVAGMTDGEIFYKITHGRDPMPSFESKISEAQRWQLVYLVRSFGSSKETE